MRRASLPIAALLPLLLLAGCRDYSIYDPDGRRYVEGYYSYAGTVAGRPGHTVSGEIVITRQYRGEAEVDIDWTYYDRGEPLFRITSRIPAVAEIDRRGGIWFEFEGDLFLYGRRTWFRLTHDGWVEGRTIYGDWRLDTDLPSTDRGSFTARR